MNVWSRAYTFILLVALIPAASFKKNLPLTPNAPPHPSNWTTISQLPFGRSTAGVASLHGYAYIAGGYDGTAKTDAVHFAALNGDGTMGSWKVTSSLLLPRYTTTAVATQGHIYVIAGQHDVSPAWLDSVEMAPVNADGSLGAWQNTSPLNVMRDNHGAVAVGGFIYALGGTTTNWSDLSTVEYAPVLSDGQLGAWQVSGYMNTPRKALAVASNGEFIYAISGGTGNLSVPFNSVERAAINPDGSLGPWVMQSNLNQGRAYSTAVVFGDKLIVIGGVSGANILDSVEVATIGTDGNLGAWELAQPLKTPRYGAGAIVIGNYLLLVGGLIPPICTTTCTMALDIDRADLTSTCSGGSARPVDVMLVIDRSGSMSTALDWEKTAAIGFVDRMNLAQDQVGLVSFESLATLNVPLTRDGNLVKNAINSLVIGGGTNTAAGIDLAQNELASSRHNPAASPVMLLMSDGKPNSAQYALESAQRAKSAGTRIFTIGLGTGVDATLMAQLASSPTDYYYAPTPEELAAIYQTIAGVVSCSPTSTWTLMYYLDGDNNLDLFYPPIFNALELAARNPYVNIVALWDRAGTGNSAYYKIQPDSDPNRVAVYTPNTNFWPMGELNMGDPATLQAFIEWARTSYPATYSALVLDNHGMGLGGGMVDDSSSGPCTSRKVDCLRVKEMGAALYAATNNGVEKIDILFMHACVMAMIEDAYQVRQSANYYIGSEAITWALNPPNSYLTPVASITAATTPEQLAVDYASAYALQADAYHFAYTISVMDLSRMDALVASLNSVSQLLAGQMAAYAPRLATIASAVQRYEMNGDWAITPADHYMDLYDFARLVKLNFTEDPSLQAEAQSLMDQIDQFVIYESHASRVHWGQSWNYANSHGLTVFFPANSSSYYSDANYDFAIGASWALQPTAFGSTAQTDPGWGSFLVSYIQATNPNAPDNPLLPDPIPPLPGYGLFLPLVSR